MGAGALCFAGILEGGGIDVKQWQREFMASILAAVITTLTSTLSVLQDHPLHEVTTTQWVIIVIGGLLAMFTGWRTLLTHPEGQKA